MLRAESNARKRLKNIPTIIPKRAAVSFRAALAVCIIGAEAMMETRLTRTMARMVYQAYSLVVTDPKRLNMKSGTWAWSPANPPILESAKGMSRIENMRIRNPWMTSVKAAAIKPPMMV